MGNVIKHWQSPQVTVAVPDHGKVTMDADQFAAIASGGMVFVAEKDLGPDGSDPKAIVEVDYACDQNDQWPLEPALERVQTSAKVRKLGLGVQSLVAATLRAAHQRPDMFPLVDMAGYRLTSRGQTVLRLRNTTLPPGVPERFWGLAELTTMHKNLALHAQAQQQAAATSRNWLVAFMTGSLVTALALRKGRV